jgi:hypothetical protein
MVLPLEIHFSLERNFVPRCLFLAGYKVLTLRIVLDSDSFFFYFLCTVCINAYTTTNFLNAQVIVQD